MNRLKALLDKLLMFNTRVFYTALLVWVYSIIWVLLEYIIYRNVEDRLIDAIIILLLVPVFYAATYAFVPSKEHKNKNKNNCNQ